jgi:type IV pilus assembly protein PilF
MNRLKQLAILAIGLASLALTACVADGPAIKQPNNQQAALRYVQLAKAYISQGHVDLARGPLQKAQQLNPKSAEVYEAFALMYQQDGDVKLEEQAYQQALSLAAKDARIHYNYGVFLYRQARYNQAIKQFTIAADDTLYTNRWQAFENTGFCYNKLGDSHNAINAFKRALAFDASLPRANLALANLYFDQGDYPQAQRFYQRYQQVTPQPSASALWLAVRLAKAQGNTEQAEDYALALAKADPDSTLYQAYRKSLTNE